MPRLASLILVSLFAGSAYAQEACKPEYNFTHSACKPTGKVLEVKTTTLNDFTAHAGACDIPDMMALGRDGIGKIKAQFPGTTDADISILSCRPVARQDYCKVMQSKQDVRCNFEVKVPVKEMVADASCPIVDVADTAGCYSKQDLAVNAEALSECKSLKPKSAQEWWVKVACLSDLNKAANDFTSKGLSKEDAIEIDRQLELALRLTKAPILDLQHSYLVSRKKEVSN